MMEERATTGQVCVTCLNTDREMFPMSKHNLIKVYEHLTGCQLFNMGKLKHTICEECMQKMLKFEEFRDMSLRARARLMELVRHGVVKKQYVNPLKLELQSEVSVKIEPEDSHVNTEPEGFHVNIVPESFHIKIEPIDPQELEAVSAKTDSVDPLAERSENVTSHAMGASSQAVASLCSRVANTDGARNYPANNEAIKIKREQDFKVDSVAHISDAAYNMMHVDYRTMNQVELPTSYTTGPAFAHATEIGSNIKIECHLVPKKPKRPKKPVRNLFVCDGCHREFKRRSYLLKHLHSYCKDRTLFVCGAKPRVLPQYRFKGEDDLLRNVRTTDTGERSFVCEICEYKCPYKSHLFRHMLTHTGEKPFACKICQKTYRQKTHLARHMKTHTAEKAFTCEVCEYKFHEKADLTKHIRIHTGEKPFTCDMCDNKFRDKGGLVDHMRMHTGEMLFACETCPFKCNRYTYLLRHMSTHTVGKPFSCEICQRKVKHKDSLLRHMKSHAREKACSDALPV